MVIGSICGHSQIINFIKFYFTDVAADRGLMYHLQ